jgi:hypothetical protein
MIDYISLCDIKENAEVEAASKWIDRNLEERSGEA